MNSQLEHLFQECLEKFPELGDVGLLVEECDELVGAEGKLGDKRVVILFVPPSLENKPEYLIPIIYHELSHMINKENPDQVFFERADEQSKKLWKLLPNMNILKCKIEG